MRYFNYLTEEERKALFFIEPAHFRRNDDKEFISHALGATLYMPANKEKIAEDIILKKIKG